MININGINNSKGMEKDVTVDTEQTLPEVNNNLIGILKPTDIMNTDNQHGFNRVHVLCCSKCDFLTISIESLHQHLKLHHSIPSDVFNELTIYSCQECQCVSTELKLIREHIKMFHELGSKSDSIDSNSKRSAATSLKIQRKFVKSKLMRKQLKLRRKLLAKKARKSPQLDGETDRENTQEINFQIVEYRPNKNSDLNSFEEKSEPDRRKDENNENDPLDMSISSITCPFKGVINTETMNPVKQEYLLNENVESFINNNNNNIINNPLLNNPQTCIELIKLTLGQMFAKSNDQNRLPIPGFNHASFLQPQFQLPPNIIPLLLPTLAPTVTNSNLNSNPNDLSFTSQSHAEIDAILSNLQQHNILKNITANNYDPNNHAMTHQQSAMFINHKSARSSPTVTKSNLFIDNIPKNGNGTLSPCYNGKKSNDCQSKISQKRQFKKSQMQSKIRNGLSENMNYLQKPDQNNENLFNRSFLDSSLSLETKTEPMDMNKVLETHNSSCDIYDSHTNTSNKSSPGGLASDKPHRQNFTSQQNRILSDWFFTHCDKPYPSTEDTKELSQLSGLTYSQVKKWFANKRARSSLNKKGHKNYCMINPAESSMDDMGNNEMCSEGLLAMSPSSGSQNDVYNATSIIKTSSSQHTSPNALDYTHLHQEELQSPEK